MTKNSFKSLKTIWFYLRNVGYLFIIFIIGWVLFNSLDQSHDFVLAFIKGPEVWYYVSVAVLLFFWSYMTWYSSSVILEINPDNYQYIDYTLEKYFHRFIGFVPYLIITITFFKSGGPYQGFGTLALGLLTLVFFKWRDGLNDAHGKWPTRIQVYEHNTDEKGNEITPTTRQEIKFIRQFHNLWYYFKNFGIIFLIVLVVLSFSSPLIMISRMLKPAAVVILSLSFFTYVFTVAFYFHDFKTRPFIVYGLAWVIIISTFNDNTKIPVTKPFKDQVDFRLIPKDAFEKWYKTKCAAWELAHGVNDSMPVIFIATQGGGIRGEIWTSEVLHYLQDSITGVKGFYNQVFCMGGASGGTVGAVYYNAFVYDYMHNHLKDTFINFSNFRKFTAADCLSPVTASFVFGENVQRLLPFAIPGLERFKVTMKAFSASYADNLKSGFADSSFLSMYYPHGDSAQFNCDIPSLFINGTLAETGQRVITSNLKIQGVGNFSNDIDFFDKVKADISIATASLNCMRFPLLLSGGLFCNEQRKPKITYSVGHVVDGGYLENTGLQAMYSLMTELRENFKGRPLKPILIYIRNGALENTVVKDSSYAFTTLQDIRTPLTTLVNVNGTSIPSLGLIKMIDQQNANSNPLNMYYNQVWLKDTNYIKKYRSYDNNDTFPLGLYISDTAFARLQHRAKILGEVNKELLNTLHWYFK